MKRLIPVCLPATVLAVCTAFLPAFAQETAADPALPAAQPAEPVVVRVAAPETGTEPLVSITFEETPLADVIKAFRDATGANIISGGTNLQGLVSVRLDNVPWKKGLASILDPQGLQLVEQPPNSEIFVVTAKTTAEIPRFTRTFPLEYTKAEDVADLFKTTIGTSGGIATPFKSANAVIVTATEQQIGECEKIIESIDKPSPQVYIEVRFAELTASASKKLGLRWDSLGGDGWGGSFGGATLDYTDDRIKNTSRTTGSGLSTTDSFVDDVRTITETRTGDNTFERTLSRSRDRIFTGSLSVNAFELTMNAFEQTDGVSIFSNPKIIVANEKEALVDMTTKEPNLTVTTSRTGTSGDQLDLSARLELIPGEKGDKDGKGKGLFAGEAFFSYGISLKVTPRISSSGLITVNIEPSISNLERYYSFDIPANASTVTPKYPVIYMQRLQTVFSMQSGSTAVIGGLSKTTENSVDSGIPGLRSLPWIGPRVFGWKSREKEQKEIVIFVTVGIADPVDLPQDVGMPKNAVLGRGILSGENKEPGDRPRSELLRLDEPKRPVSPVDQPAAESSLPAAPASQAPAAPPPDAPANEREAAQEAAAPAAIEPLLRNE